jgi:hypothetical protein
MNTWLVAAVSAATLIHTTLTLEGLVNSDGHYFSNFVFVQLFTLQLFTELNSLRWRDLDLRELSERIKILKGLLYFVTKASNDL